MASSPNNSTLDDQDSRGEPTSQTVTLHQALELEMQHHQNGDQSSPRRKQLPSPLYIKLRFVGLCTIGLALALTCPETELHQDPNNSSMDWSLALKAALSYLLTLASFFFLQATDPGYLTPEIMENFEDPDCQTLLEHDDNNNNNSNSQRQADEQGEQPSTMTQRRSLNQLQDNSSSHPNSTNNNQVFEGTRRRYCPSCRLLPPLRSHHCKDCDKCVANFDHHCHFVGTCIGERNHCRFWWYLLIQTMAFDAACSIVGSSKLGVTTFLFPPTPEPPISMVLHVIAAKCYLYPLRVCAWLMVMIHTWMAVTNSTTFELSKGSRHIDYLKGTKLSDLPFSQGLMGNLRIFCCQKDDLLQVVRKDSLLWRPTLWQPPGEIIRDSEDWWANPWQNKYWSCC